MSQIPVSDLLCEAGALSLNDPTGETPEFSIENATLAQQAPDVFEQSPFSVPTTEDTSWSDGSWDLYKLYLAEMGHRGNQPGIHNTAPSVPQAPIQQLGQPPSINDTTYTFWSDTSTAYNCFEEWDRYIQSMGQLECSLDDWFI
ncbi:hypothetical protein JR316_0007633 [Psilocybe cubensis]|uniref:Uncharacterized protein n=2 Tax=Psilocybe cubensis TaxID=181762 RepID=A0ACB8GU00_PSICU|nr:hypothetical protein JR316_0007633 [Psilocybe cubensis]KAH9479056.1 hypothetical protein JR316_0007633 [Psilocybe cubensis]